MDKRFLLSDCSPYLCLWFAGSWKSGRVVGKGVVICSSGGFVLGCAQAAMT